ncbi:MAG: C40 family peptidase [Armatimonadota bacterium]
MKKTSLLITIFFTLGISCIGYAQQTLTVNLDPPQSEQNTTPQAKSPQLKHESLSSSRNNAQPKYQAQTSVSNKSAGNETVIGKVGIIQAAKANIHRVPGTSGPVLFTCPKETPLAVTSEVTGWYGVLMADSSIGWIQKGKVEILDYNILGYQTSGGSTGGNTIGSSIVNNALRYLGIPYRWGGNTQRGIDCSGFVKSVFANHGISLPRVARDQARVGQSVTWNELQPGDRLYFSCKGRIIDHTGIYMGNGLFIHSSTGRGGVAIDKIMKPLFAKSLVVARR